MATGVAVFVVVVLLSLVVVLLQKKENKFKEVSVYCLGLLESCDCREDTKKRNERIKTFYNYQPLLHCLTYLLLLLGRCVVVPSSVPPLAMFCNLFKKSIIVVLACMSSGNTNGQSSIFSIKFLNMV